ncbi:unnamed protein product, partial [Meganyctiphanes norvegica]
RPKMSTKLLLLLGLCMTWAEQSIAGRVNEGLNTCPLAFEISPCSCTYDEDLYEPDLYCPHIGSIEQLQEIFTTAHFPEKRFWRIRVSGAPLGDIPEDVFNDVAFDEIHLNACNITSVHPDAFSASKPNMDTWEMYSNKLTDSSFPWSTLGEYPKLWWVHVDHNDFTTFPTLSSEYLEDINLWKNPITYFGREQLSGAPNLRILNVSPYIESFSGDSFLDLTQLEEIHLSNNNIGDLGAGQITLNSEKFSYLYLQNCSIADIHPEAITGVMSTRLKVFLEHNHLTQLQEEVFRPLTDHMLDGWGELELEDNPLICDCNMYWLLSNQTLLDNVRTGTCDDGTPLKDVDISEWNC